MFTATPHSDPTKTVTNVAHIAFSLKTGGMERLLVDFARHSSRQFYSLHFFSLTERGPVAAEIESCGSPVIPLEKQAGFKWSAVARLAIQFRKYGIQVVHTHNSGAMIYGAFAAKLAGTPCVVHTRHGQRFGSGKRHTRLFARVSRLVDRVVAVSEDCSALSVNEGVSATRVQTIWNGIDLDRFSFAGPDSSRPAIVVARLAPEKDLYTLIRAAAIVSQRFPSFRLNIVGDGPCRDGLEALVDQLELRDSIDFLGERSDVPALLQRASMFVLPSKSEGISLTLLEAMSSGLPVIATKVGGNPEVVVDGKTGLLTPVGDAESLADAMVSLASDRQRAADLGRNGRARVEQHFDIKSMVGSYEAIYEEVMAKKRRRLRVKLLPRLRSTPESGLSSAASITARS